MSVSPIELRGVDFAYSREAPVFRGLDLCIGGGLTLLLGPNGSGKSTLLKMIAGIEMPDGGRVLIDGLDLWREEAAARRCLAYVPELPDLAPYASIREVLELVCRLRGEALDQIPAVLQELDIETVSGRSVRELSKGQGRRALLAAAKLATPKLLLLDEPLDALDRPMRLRILDWIDGHCRSGGHALVVSHEIEPFVALATRAVGVDSGDVRLVDPLPQDAVRRTALLEALAAGEALIPGE